MSHDLSWKGVRMLSGGILIVVAVLSASATAGAQVITEFALDPSRFPADICNGFDQSVWFSEGTVHQIGRLTTAYLLTEYATPTGGSFPRGITRGSDGNFWFAGAGEGMIGRVTRDGQFTMFPIVASPTAPQYITAGPDGALWFSDAADRIGRITTSGQIMLFPIPTPAGGPYQVPFGIAAGPDGNLWFTEHTGNRIGRMTPTGALTEFSVPTPNTVLYSITAGPDGAMWFTEQVGNKIGRITMTGRITEFPLPTPESNPHGIALGSDGNLWFVQGRGAIGRITPSGVITQYDTPTPGSGPLGITAGPDGALWFTEPNVGKIGRITTGVCAATSTSLCLNAQRFEVSVDWTAPSLGTSGHATAVPLTADTGYFWFFTANNVELTVKVVDGRAFNNRFWVFGGALSDVGYTIVVRDSVTGQTRTYANPPGTLASFADTSAF